MFSASGANFGCYLQCLLSLEQILGAICNVFCLWSKFWLVFAMVSAMCVALLSSSYENSSAVWKGRMCYGSGTYLAESISCQSECVSLVWFSDARLSLHRWRGISRFEVIQTKVPHRVVPIHCASTTAWVNQAAFLVPVFFLGQGGGAVECMAGLCALVS